MEAFQSDAFVVVERTTDEPRLSALLPLELGRVFAFVAGTGRDVEQVVRMLNSEPLPVPHIGIRDRDYMSDDQAAQLESDIPNLFVWSKRSIENEILFPALIARTLARIGRTVSPDEVIERLRQLANDQRETVRSEFVEARLRQAHSYTKAGETALERQRHHLEDIRRIAEQKLGELDDVAAQVDAELAQRWDADFLRLVDGKRLLAEFVEFTGFRSLRDLLAALTATVQEHPELLPPNFVHLRERLRALLPVAAAAQ
jgi:hypothetical protein